MPQPTLPQAERSIDRHEWIEETVTEGTHTCPICGYAADRQNRIYVHLQTSHRKSAIARAVLDDVRARESDDIPECSP